VKIFEGVHYIMNPLSDIWVGIIAVMGEQLLLVDSATQASVNETILPYLAYNDLYRPGQSVLVVNTHCHCDHIGGNAALKKMLGADIAAHKADAAYIESRIIQLEALYGFFSGYKDLAMDREKFLELAGADTPVNLRLVDGDKIKLGRLEFEVIHSPGHSDGSIALFEASQGLLLVGDSIQGNGTADTEVPLIIDMPSYRQSMHRLADLDVALLVAAHPFKPHQGAIFRKSNASRFIRESEAISREYLDRVASLLSTSSGPISLFDLGTRLAKELDLRHTNRYLLMLISASLDELITYGQAQCLSGISWHPASTFVSLP
jgi:glyoxylase-like metal-dependent hydrolase (beta-lactamase superfamily II)